MERLIVRKRSRTQRQDHIREFVRSAAVRTQQDLVDHLLHQGYDCTQATISRDISELGLVKSDDGVYALPEDLRLKNMIATLVEEIYAVGNFLVIKTAPGGAPGVASAIDDATVGVIGTVAGNNTLFAAAESCDAAQQAYATLNGLRRR